MVLVPWFGWGYTLALLFQFRLTFKRLSDIYRLFSAFSILGWVYSGHFVTPESPFLSSFSDLDSRLRRREYNDLWQPPPRPWSRSRCGPLCIILCIYFVSQTLTWTKQKLAGNPLYARWTFTNRSINYDGKWTQITRSHQSWTSSKMLQIRWVTSILTARSLVSPV